MKKAQGMPMQIIVIAVLLILAGGVIGYIFITKGTIPFSRGLAACKERGGVCINIADNTCEQTDSSFPVHGFKGCYEGDEYKKDWVCCLPG